MKLILTLSFIAFSWTSLACKPSAPKEINFHIDLEKGLRKFYTSKALLDQRPSLSVDECAPTAASNSFVMFGLGIENLILSNDTIGFNMTPQEEVLDCKLKNNPFPFEETKEMRNKKNREKREFFNKCVVVQVTELNENIPLRYPENQPGCQVTPRSKWSADFTGGYCFFQPYQTSVYSVHLDVKKECLTKEYIAKTKINLSDYTAILNTYIAGDATGFSPDLTAISTTSVRLSMSPLSSIMPRSEDFGSDRPVWPTTWNAADIHMGELEIKNFGPDQDEIKLPLAVSNYCKETCSEGICSSPCDYSQPVVGEFSLYEVVNGKREFIKLWYDGSVASPSFQGLLHGMGVTIPQNALEGGKKYVIEAIFSEPDLDFSFFSGRIKRELSFDQNYIGPLSRSGQINLIREINTINNTDDIPSIPVITNLSFDNSQLDGLSRTLATWRSRLNNAFWPPFFDNMCGTKGCLQSGTGYVKLTKEFTLGERSSRGYPIKNVTNKRESNLVSNFTNTGDQTPKVDCGFDFDDDEDENDIDWGDFL